MPAGVLEGTHRAASLRPAKKEREQTWVRERVTDQSNGQLKKANTSLLAPRSLSNATPDGTVVKPPKRFASLGDSALLKGVRVKVPLKMSTGSRETLPPDNR